MSKVTMWVGYGSTKHQLEVDNEKEKIGAIAVRVLNVLQGNTGTGRIAGKSLAFSSSLGRKTTCTLPGHSAEFQGKVMIAVSRVIR